MYLFIINNYYYLKELFLQISYHALQFSQVNFFLRVTLNEYNISHDARFNMYKRVSIYFFVLQYRSKLKSSIGKQKKRRENEFSLLLLFIDNNCKV